MNYTRGEWIKEGNKIIAFGRGTIAICPSPTNNGGVLEFIANAHLIAAAPDLYEALKLAIPHLIFAQGVIIGNKKLKANCHQVQLTGERAIAKAEEVK